MDMADKIVVDYNALQQVGNSFSQQEQEINNMLKKIQSQVDALQGGGWIGKGANAFYNEMHNELLPAIQRLVKALEEGQHVVAQMAQQFQNAEEETKSIWNFM
jgi:WXG100 family type VII secretion target